MNPSLFVECKSTGCKLPECVAREVDTLYQTLPAGCEYRTKTLAVDYQFEPQEQAEVSILTNNTVDKMNEVVIPSGVDLDPYRKSMVVLWNHDMNKPVAKCGWIKLQGDTIRAKTIYPPDSTEFTQEAWHLTKSGVLKAKSIGFLNRTPKREPTEEELEVHPEWKGAGIWDDVMLLEYSLCSVGMNNDSLVELVNRKSLDLSRLASMGLELPPVAQTKAEPQPCPKCAEREQSMSALLATYKADSCVSDKIKWMYDNGEDSKYSKAQIAAIAYHHCNKKGCGCIKKPAKPKRNIGQEISKALKGVELDMNRVVAMALEAYRNRGRV